MFPNAICSLPPPRPAGIVLPSGSVLSLPSGEVGAWDGGWLHAMDRWVVAVGLAPDLFLVARERLEKFISTRLYHELLGYLHACGCTLLPVDIRCPLDWRRAGSFISVQNQWLAAYFDEAPRILFEASSPPSRKPFLSLPFLDRATDAALFWEAAGRVTEALSEMPNGLPEPWFSRLLSLSRRWEIYWNHLLAAEPVPSDPEEWISRCDCAWAAVARRHLLPRGYQFQPSSTSRLL